MRFKDRVLFATGAASGLAAATVAKFAEEGGHVAVVDLDLDRAGSIAADLPSAIPVQCDVADEDSVKRAVAAVDKHFGRVDCVVNCAGHVIAKSIEDTTVAEWNKMMTVHTTGPFLIIRELLPLLKQSGAASIVNISSIAAVTGTTNRSAYTAAKGAVLAMSRQMAIELAPFGIRVNTVLPGSIDTPMSQQMASDNATGRGTGYGALLASVPLGRMGVPQDVAAAILFLLSDDASYFTGTSLTPDGGRTAMASVDQAASRVCAAE
ncbi:SDR family NAD(P)-dependent oxidoreductase [Celeribacter indicus]|uniref:Short-chain dehydrogenase/reductase SDR n=1 Tax=Celeribacter indicus TaxID=1208324 RepID=A0A0B5DWP3_9RHOB|nr:SDR family oxidoreductase [Celeribacter indicus]AJE47848.1 short-chain dehydrogenase/reductase SDR [Celeribacter indicus]SDW24817.1 3-oxoacyl-[acyl-carrier protein] reductase [Celeribacter indicus]